MTSFAIELRRAMRVRGLRITDVMARTGLSEATIVRHRRGIDIPRLATAATYAEALDWPSLLAIVSEARQGACELCGAPFVDAGKARRRRFCGMRCQRTVSNRQWRRSEREVPSRIMRTRLDVFHAAVAAHCRGCEPEGLCRDAECALRPVSPLAYVAMRRVA